MEESAASPRFPEIAYHGNSGPAYYSLEASAKKLLKRLFFRIGKDFKNYLQSWHLPSHIITKLLNGQRFSGAIRIKSNLRNPPIKWCAERPRRRLSLEHPCLWRNWKWIELGSPRIKENNMFLFLYTWMAHGNRWTNTISRSCSVNKHQINPQLALPITSSLRGWETGKLVLWEPNVDGDGKEKP